MATTVTQKGQVTIPKPVRDRLHIKPGSKVEFGLTPDGQVVLTKVGKQPTAKGKSRFDRIRGTATTDMTTDEIMALMRGPPPEV